ncbi:Protein of unknown function, partial [Gryllus bimaculatus]
MKRMDEKKIVISIFEFVSEVFIPLSFAAYIEKKSVNVSVIFWLQAFSTEREYAVVRRFLMFLMLVCNYKNLEMKDKIEKDVLKFYEVTTTFFKVHDYGEAQAHKPGCIKIF